MNHEQLREALVDHIREDDAAHDVLVAGLAEHIAADEEGDTDHSAIVALLDAHIRVVAQSHEHLLEALDAHIQRSS